MSGHRHSRRPPSAYLRGAAPHPIITKNTKDRRSITIKQKTKDIKFSTRMASEDREAIKKLAKQSNMSMSDYVTACCLGQQIVIIDGLKEVLQELRSIRKNLNQLVMLAHMGRVTVVNLSEVFTVFSELRDALRAIAERRHW